MNALELRKPGLTNPKFLRKAAMAFAITGMVGVVVAIPAIASSNRESRTPATASVTRTATKQAKPINGIQNVSQASRQLPVSGMRL